MAQRTDTHGFLGVNAHLRNVPGGRRQLNTPVLLIDLDRLERNLTRMADHCRRSGLGLRPHTKTHKSVEIARRQLAAGAVGLCCAKLGEAEALMAGGLDSILVTSPVVREEGARRAARLNAAIRDFMIVADSARTLDLLAEAGRSSGRPLQVIMDMEVGLRRTGALPGPGALDLARRIHADPHLRLAGIQGYAGHLMHIPDREARRRETLGAMRILAETRAALVADGLPCDIVTGGGTGTFDLDPEAKILTDLQAGSYLFMDGQYVDVWAAEGRTPPFETALSVQTSVISANIPGFATTDAGLKSFATDAKAPRILEGAPAGTIYDVTPGDEQGGLEFPDRHGSLPLGAVVRCAAPHCDPTVNLYDHYHVVRGDELVDIWPIEGRGRSQ